MLARIAVRYLGFCVFFSATLLAQLKSAALAAFTAEEFPIALQQSVTAGKTPVGTKVQAKLEVPTLVNGTVLPRNAVFSGEVIESAAKTPTTPSRLAIRMDSVQWKNGSAPLKVYMTAWYYPTVDEAGQNLQYGPPQDPRRTWNGIGPYPDPNSPAYKPFPGTDSDKGSSVPNATSSTTSNHRVLMKNVQSERDNEGAIALVSSHSNIKLDKLTTYVLASGDLLPASAK
jgi:hypothetical protein